MSYLLVNRCWHWRQPNGFSCVSRRVSSLISQRGQLNESLTSPFMALQMLESSKQPLAVLALEALLLLLRSRLGRTGTGDFEHALKPGN